MKSLDPEELAKGTLWMLLKGDKRWVCPFPFAPFFTPPIAGTEKQQGQGRALPLSQLWAETGTDEGAEMSKKG